MESNLFQSANWAHFQEKNGRKTVFIESAEIRGRVVVETLPLVGKFLYFPRGPILEANIPARLAGGEYPITNIKKQLLRLVAEEKTRWVRVEPESDEALKRLQEIFGKSVREAPHDIQPREILIVPLEGSREDWLTRMKSKTRYNIRLAEKHGVTVRFSRGESDIETFIALIRETTRRKGVAPHPESYYRNFFTAFPEEQCTIGVAEHEGDILAAGLFIFWEQTAYYLHGGSSDVKRELMAPFLLHYRAMEEAKRRGCSQYDFGGIATENQESRIKNQESWAKDNHSRFKIQDSKLKDWAGITRFKLGFAPDTETTIFPGTFDIVFDRKRYFLYRLLSRISERRKRWRKFLSH